jgi:hypothetical protein
MLTLGASKVRATPIVQNPLQQKLEFLVALDRRANAEVRASPVPRRSRTADTVLRA